MPKITVSEKCSRCPREEHMEVTIDEAIARAKNPVPKAKALEVILDGKSAVTYPYLCEECRGIVVGYAESMKPQEKKSARRFKRVSTAPEEPAAPARSTPSARH